MSTENCKKKMPCGCDDGAHEPGVVCNTQECENPDPCPETFSAGCVVWTGQDIICNGSVIAREGYRMDAIIENIIANFCGPAGTTPPQQDINLLHPLPNELLSGTDDHVICIDRINCFEDITVTFGNNAPPGIMFDWDDIGGNPQVTDTMIIDHSLSCIPFDLTGGQGQGVVDFELEITGCGDTLIVPFRLTFP